MTRIGEDHPGQTWQLGERPPGRHTRSPLPAPDVARGRPPGKWIEPSRRSSDMSRQREDFVSFYESAKDDCFRTVLVSVGHFDTAEDLVAEAFARAWASWSTVREHPAPRAWIVRTALNAHVSSWRRRRRDSQPSSWFQPRPDEDPTEAGVDPELVFGSDVFRLVSGKSWPCGSSSISTLRKRPRCLG